MKAEDYRQVGLYKKLVDENDKLTEHVLGSDQSAERSCLQSYRPDSHIMHRVLKAYGTIDQQAAQCTVGYNYIIALLMRFI